MEQVM